MDINIERKFYHTNFGSRRKNGQSFEDFERLNRDAKIEEKLRDIIADKNNYMAEGRFNKIYNIPCSDSFMLKAYKGITPENIHQFQTTVTKTEDLFPKINVGQPVASLGKYLLVMLKQNGEEYSVPFTHRENMSEQDINKYLSDIRKIASMEQGSYNAFTDEVKELTKNNCYIDYFNSNNLMTTDKEINIVDIIKIKRAKQRAFMFPSKESLMKIFADENVLPVIIPKITTKQREELGENIELISEKTSKAMEHSQLPENKLLTNVLDFLMDKFWHGNNKKFKIALSNICLKK